MIAHRSLLLIFAAALVCVVPMAEAGAATRFRQKACASVVQPYPDSRYEDVPLSRITAAGVKCSTARSVARGAHRKALGAGVPEDGIRRFTWNGWKVTGDLRPANDRYVATRRGRTVRWRF